PLYRRDEVATGGWASGFRAWRERAPPAPRSRGEPAAPPAAPHPEGDAAVRARSPRLVGRGARLSPPAAPCPRPAPPRIGGPGAHPSRARNADAHPTGGAGLLHPRGLRRLTAGATTGRAGAPGSPHDGVRRRRGAVEEGQGW